MDVLEGRRRFISRRSILPSYSNRWNPSSSAGISFFFPRSLRVLVSCISPDTQHECISFSIRISCNTLLTFFSIIVRTLTYLGIIIGNISLTKILPGYCEKFMNCKKAALQYYRAIYHFIPKFIIVSTFRILKCPLTDIFCTYKRCKRNVLKCSNFL